MMDGMKWALKLNVQGVNILLEKFYAHHEEN
jgi:hypothetical protein